MDSEAQESKYIAIGNDSGAHITDLPGDGLSLMPNGDRVLLDEDGEIIGVFPVDYAVFKDEPEEEDNDESDD